jgi:DNA invertase Pin-like site-specific DNA recombinase
MGRSASERRPFTALRKKYRFRHMSKGRKARAKQHPVNGRLRDKATALLIGYMRVSKADGSQVLDLQKDALLKAGANERHLYSDRASGKQDDRPGLAACLQALREGDTLTVWKLDRLGRSLRHLVNVVNDLTSRGIGLKVLAGHGAAIDTTTPAGKLVFGIFASLAEFERDLISERTRAGLASARARGRKGGRRPKMTSARLRLAMAAMGKPETNVGDLCRELGITRSTLYRHVSPEGKLRGNAIR